MDRDEVKAAMFGLFVLLPALVLLLPILLLARWHEARNERRYFRMLSGS